MSPPVSKVGFVTSQPPREIKISNDISIAPASRGDEESAVSYTDFFAPATIPLLPTYYAT